jgi:hypothetical protein
VFRHRLPDTAVPKHDVEYFPTFSAVFICLELCNELFGSQPVAELQHLEQRVGTMWDEVCDLAIEIPSAPASRVLEGELMKSSHPIRPKVIARRRAVSNRIG